jgi:hypothetical protein
MLFSLPFFLPFFLRFLRQTVADYAPTAINRATIFPPA